MFDPQPWVTLFSFAAGAAGLTASYGVVMPEGGHIVGIHLNVNATTLVNGEIMTAFVSLADTAGAIPTGSPILALVSGITNVAAASGAYLSGISQYFEVNQRVDQGQQLFHIVNGPASTSSTAIIQLRPSLRVSARKARYI